MTTRVGGHHLLDTRLVITPLATFILSCNRFLGTYLARADKMYPALVRENVILYYEIGKVFEK